jgi:outer membrane protein OmpA-like peptidoglycan-associated protein
MRWGRTIAACSLVVLIHAGTLQAQDGATRPAMTTATGDTGLWFVPTAEVLPRGRVSLSTQRTESDFRQGHTNVSSWPITGAVGLGRMEIYGALHVVTAIDRDVDPLLLPTPNTEVGGLVNEYPAVVTSWTGNNFGDLRLGGKFNLTSQERLDAMAFAIRTAAKLPTGDKDDGTSTGEYDAHIDLVTSGEAGGIELTGFGGYIWRGDPDEISLSDGIRWGGGAAFPARRALRLTTEAWGEWMLDDAVGAPAGRVVGLDGSLSPTFSRLDNQINTSVGLTWQHRGGMLLGAAFTYRFGLGDYDLAGNAAETTGDAMGMQFRIGFHSGVKVFVPPAPAVALVAPPPPAAAPAPPAPAPPPPPPPPPAANRMPTLRAVCEPCRVTTGQTATLRAESTDPDGDPLTFTWSVTGGTLSDTRTQNTTWTAETAPGFVTFTVVVEDNRGARLSDTVSIEVAGSDVVTFEDVHFALDSYTLRPEVLATLEPAIAALQKQPQMRITIEGHTCDLGTPEYNLALGGQRAAAVRDFLVSRGVDASRLTTVSYGEEHPSHANTHESSRAMNRRAVLVVRVGP